MDSDKKIFPYLNADGATVYGDPLAIDRKLCLLLDGSPNKVIDDYNSPIPEVALGVTDKLVGAVCEAFALGPPFDPATGKGARLETILAALDAFTSFMELKKKSAAPSPTCSPVSEPPGATTPNSSDSTPTVLAPDCSLQAL